VDDLEVRKKLWVQARSKLSFAWTIVMTVFIDITPQVTDFVFEAMNMTQYHRNEDYWWLALTLVPIFLPGIVFGVYDVWDHNLQFYGKKKLRKKKLRLVCVWTIFFPIIPIAR
jgi:hypothetical protein